MEQQEFVRLRGLWLAAGGACVCVGSPLDDFVRGEQFVRGRTLLKSELWGEIDLNRLNQGLSAYRGAASIALLARDLALASNRFQLDIQRLPTEIAHRAKQKTTALMRRQAWKRLVIDWRRTCYLSQLIGTACFQKRYAGESGYDRCAEELFQGDALKAYLVVSALLTREAFAGLEWGKQKQVAVQKQDALRKLLGSGNYQGKRGYDRFAKAFFQGDSLKAYQVAGALLPRQVFSALGWGKRKQGNVQDEARLRKALLSGRYQGEEGYDRFADEVYQGNTRTAYQVASALLTRKAFATLGWGKQKQVFVQDQARIRKALVSGGYRGKAGYDQFAEAFFQGNAKKAYVVASALLTPEAFVVLGWGGQKQVHVQDQGRLRDALESGRYNGQAGYDRFAEDYFLGDALKAYRVARTLLLSEMFAALGWGKQRPIRVQDQLRVREALASGRYQGGEGYDCFAEEFFFGDTMKAYQVASSLLKPGDFAALRWGKMKVIRVQEQTKIREALASGGYQDESGYDRFAEDFFLGDAAKAYQVANAQLSREAFVALGWGKKKLVNVRVQTRLREALASGAYSGREGRMRFVAKHFALMGGRSIANVYRKSSKVASALLQSHPEVLASLGWASTARLTADDESTIQAWMQAATVER